MSKRTMRWNELNEVLWTSPSPRKTIVVVDSSFAEVFKWQEVDFGDDCILFDLTADKEILRTMQGLRVERILFFLSNVDIPTLNVAKKQLVSSRAPECCLLTSVSPLLAASHSTSSSNLAAVVEESPYAFIEEIFLPVQTNVFYLPIHSIDLLNTPKDAMDSLELRILSNHAFRQHWPLSLGSLRKKLAKPVQSLWEVTAADLPMQERSDLKALAQELSACLLNDLEVDPKCIYALGKTSSLVGHSLLSIVEGEQQKRQLDQKGLAQSHHLRDLLLGGGGEHGVMRKPHGRSAGVLLVDRWEDLATPLSALGGSIAQRVLNTCSSYSHSCGYSSSSTASFDSFDGNSQSSSIGQPYSSLLSLTVQPRYHQRLFSASASTAASSVMEIGSVNNTSCEAQQDDQGGDRSSTTNIPLQNPLSAVEGLAVSLPLSLCYHDYQERRESEEVTSCFSTHAIRRACFISTEESARSHLTECWLSLLTQEEGGQAQAQSITKKKRGMGAELHALVTAWLTIMRGKGNGSGNSSRGSRQRYGLYRYESLLSLTMAVIEAMQRSNYKQYQAGYKAQLQQILTERNTVKSWLSDFPRDSQQNDIEIEIENEPFRLSYDLRQSREEDMIKYVKASGSLDTPSPLLFKGWLKNLIHHQQQEAKEMMEIPCDSIHLLGLSIELLSLTRYGEPLPGLQPSQQLATYLLPVIQSMRPAERRDLQALGLLTNSRLLLSSNSYDENELMVSLEEDLTALDDLLAYYQHSRKKDMFNLGGPFFNFLHHGVEENKRGLLARLLTACLRGNGHSHGHGHGHGGEDGYDGDDDLLTANFPKVAEYIESPLRQMARAGLGFLSKGLGKLGLSSNLTPGTSTPLPCIGDEDVIVICVLGGIGLQEASHCQSVLSQFLSCSSHNDHHTNNSWYGEKKKKNGKRVILLSTTVLQGEEVVVRVLQQQGL
eukprot:gene4798-5261_t